MSIKYVSPKHKTLGYLFTSCKAKYACMCTMFLMIVKRKILCINLDLTVIELMENFVI